jgi:antitoxin VapB
MSTAQICKLFPNGRSQAVRLPQNCRFDATEVYVRRDPLTGDVIVSTRPDTWDDLFAKIDEAHLHVTCLNSDEANLGMTDASMFGV